MSEPTLIPAEHCPTCKCVSRFCEQCGAAFVRAHGRQRFCGRRCSGVARNRRWRKEQAATTAPVDAADIEWTPVSGTITHAIIADRVLPVEDALAWITAMSECPT
jgi:hypothetical protein